jgi:anti-sigma regulatory factor (Ser/Thr protein kinase)
MIYTINYKDILAFKNNYPTALKDNSATIKKIFYKISDIKENLENDNFIILTFDETVKFVDPIFFILLFDLYYEHHLTLVLDIKYMDDKSQHYIHRLLTQYSDLEHFQVYSPYAKKDIQEIYITIDSIIKSDKDERERQFKRFLENNLGAIHLFSSVAHKKSLINDSQYEYSLLPILKLRNYTLKEINTFIHEDSLEPYDKRINFYNKLSLNQAEHHIEQYRTDLHDKIKELLVAVGLDNRGLSNSFRDIFFELIDNIRKHTSRQTNAHISFRKDLASDLYELIISDNSNKGFLNTYRETLEKEQSRLEQSGVNKNLLQNYLDVVNDINDKNYKKVLTGLFRIEKQHPQKSKDDIHIHQIPRIAMHFGLPLLVKLLEKLAKKESTTTPELKLFLHNEEQYFEIIYSFKNGKFKLDINDNSSHRMRGTYIIITFPADVVIAEENNSNTLININFQNNDYKLFLEKKEMIKNQINKFSFYLDKHIEEDLDMSSSYVYSSENKCTFIKYTGHNTFSEFLRNIYLYAYKHDMEDIVVINVPLYG